MPDYIAGSRVKLTLSDLRLDLIIPDDGLQNIPRGYVDPNLLDAGSSIFFLTILEIIIILIMIIMSKIKILLISLLMVV
ncbi:FimD/PapC N-terminal domain-containing protein [Arsenophonus endosymbiont of Aphis craccivora]|uniref:FimD/PapC N-terminal domain-containing protein n=1 Tax=Arsenophonus endosymbiont of Aphis craccivora TaxID=1231049 RepID=UPI0015DF354E|nr:FimD/PapC N-terminal domain-containing protein [Arsenophonus endosymbiont of Aphis craccivora]